MSKFTKVHFFVAASLGVVCCGIRLVTAYGLSPSLTEPIDWIVSGSYFYSAALGLATSMLYFYAAWTDVEVGKSETAITQLEAWIAGLKHLPWFCLFGLYGFLSVFVVLFFAGDHSFWTNANTGVVCALATIGSYALFEVGLRRSLQKERRCES